MLKDHNAVTPMRLEPAAPKSRVKHSTTEPLCSPSPFRGQKFHLSACNYERNLERTNNSSQSTRPVGRVLWERITRGSHITLLCSLLHTLLKDTCMCCRTSENCKSLVLQDKCNIRIFLSPALYNIPH